MFIPTRFCREEAMISAFAAWIGNDGAPLLAIKSGEQDKKGASDILANCFLLLIGMGVFLTFAAYASYNTLLVHFGATERVLPHAHAYMRVYLAGTIFAVVSLGLNQFIICQGFAGLSIASVVIGAVSNIILDPIFIFGLGMDVAGAAAATVVSQAASCAFTLLSSRGDPSPQKFLSSSAIPESAPEFCYLVYPHF
ncbi:MAG: MATE family efflux transporter [Roseburia sp.]